MTSTATALRQSRFSKSFSRTLLFVVIRFPSGQRPNGNVAPTITKLGAHLCVPRLQCVEQRVELGAMIHVHGVTQLVSQHAADEMRWQEHQPRVQADRATCGAAAPATALESYRRPPIRQIERCAQFIESARQVCASAPREPSSQRGDGEIRIIQCAAHAQLAGVGFRHTHGPGIGLRIPHAPGFIVCPQIYAGRQDVRLIVHRANRALDEREFAHDPRTMLFDESGQHSRIDAIRYDHDDPFERYDLDVYVFRTPRMPHAVLDRFGLQR